MSRNTMSKLAVVAICYFSLALPAFAADTSDQNAVSLDKQAIRTGNSLQITCSLPSDCTGMAVQVRRLFDGAVVADLPVPDDSGGLFRLSWDSTGIPEGSYYVRVTGSRAAGGTMEQVCHFIVDNSAPVTTLSPPAGSGGLYCGPVSFNASDRLSGVASIYFRLDEGRWQVYENASTGIMIPEGNHTISYWSLDRAGNLEAPKTTALKVADASSVPAGSTSGTPVMENSRSSYTPEALQATPEATPIIVTALAAALPAVNPKVKNGPVWMAIGSGLLLVAVVLTTGFMACMLVYRRKV